MIVRAVLASLCLLSGAFVFSVCVLGLFRFNNVLDRMHAASLGDTMGIFLTVLGVILLSDNIYQIVKLALIVIFIWMTSPVATHLIAKMELLTADKPRRKGRNIR